MQIELKFTTPLAKEYSLLLPPKTTVRDMRVALAKKYNLDIPSHQLVYMSRLISDDNMTIDFFKNENEENIPIIIFKKPTEKDPPPRCKTPDPILEAPPIITSNSNNNFDIQKLKENLIGMGYAIPCIDYAITVKGNDEGDIVDFFESAEFYQNFPASTQFQEMVHTIVDIYPVTTEEAAQILIANKFDINLSILKTEELLYQMQEELF
ncbi:hypothetical protein GPJ56_009603 [Histomonas meleagridis]|uniref:uncharacterized protein n=1 Tax=Histomonas meleagridis TaxID=135588 RepID=UPI00355A3A0B|nr:hypothetical protein GPJ56_009603 [Histomonas meleagridis]KAH0799630.1 hypothetical protein GO595_007544 [Histomonas meleagridis]